MRMYFLDSTEGNKHEYNQNGFARFHNQIIGSGVANTDAYKVSAKTNMDVALSLGWIFAKGYALELEATKTLTHDVADPDNDRIDRVVIRFDTNPEKNDFYPMIIKGTPARSPVPPSITRDNYIHDMSVAQVRITAGKSFIEQYQISDERSDDEVCGYIPLHNIYRGLSINENGLVTLPNQSFVKASNDIPVKFKRESTILPFGTIEKDKQKEVSSDQQKFIAKANGIYHFWVELAWLEDNELPENINIHIYLYKNGRESFPLTAKWIADSRDKYVVGSGTDILEEGDEVTIVTRVYFLGEREMPGTRFTRIRIAKMA